MAAGGSPGRFPGGSPPPGLERGVGQESWCRSLWSALSETALVTMSYVSSSVTFNMKCFALLQDTSDPRTFGLTVICQRDNEPLTQGPGTVVGKTIHPKQFRSGCIRVRLVTGEFEADIANGESRGLTKEEKDFRGRSFEIQFACKYKRFACQSGVFGKVIVEHLMEGEFRSLCEFNISRTGTPRRLPVDSEEKWSSIAVKELAGMLQISDPDTWQVFARKLGFTDHEIRQGLVTGDDPVPQLLAAYQERGGTPREFVRQMRMASKSLSMSDDLPLLMEPPPPSPRKRSRPRPLDIPQDEVAYLGDFDDTMPPPSPRFAAELAEGPLTPPLTPQKRLQMYDPCLTPTKRLRRTSTGDTDFVFDFPDSAEEVPTSILWQISEKINHRWKSVGRNLGLPEEELLSIEHAHKELRECAYQALLKWKDMCPNKYNYSFLHNSLKDAGLISVAQKYCTP